MNKKRMIFAAAIIAIAATGCSGPSSSDIEAVAREQMIAGLASSGLTPEQAVVATKVAKEAKIEKRGMCNTSKPNIYACIVTVTSTLPGEAEKKQELVVEVTKGSDGKWTAAKD